MARNKVSRLSGAAMVSKATVFTCTIFSPLVQVTVGVAGGLVPMVWIVHIK